MKKLLWLPTFMSLACGLEPPSETCYYFPAENITNYTFKENVVLESGIRLDTSGYQLDTGFLNKAVDDTESCLKEQEKNERFAIKRECLRIKIADDWLEVSCAGHPQAFPCAIPDEVCAEAKAKRGICERTPQFDPDKCYCGGTIQDGNTLILPPDVQALPHELVHLVTQAPDPIPKPLDWCAH